MEALLEMRGIALRYGSVQALAGVDLRLDTGEVHGLLGENGAGKSSLMQVLVGAVRPAAGTMRLAGAAHAPASAAEAQRAGVVMVFQELTLLGHLSIAENLWLGREHSIFGLVDRRRRHAAVASVLARLHRSELDLGTRVSRLAPGDRQMIEIARALLGNPKVIVFDEPTSSLDADDVQRLFTVIRQLRAEGLGIVYISHLLDEVRELCDRCTVLRDGRSVAASDLADVDDKSLIALMAGRPLEGVFPEHRQGRADPVLEVRDLSTAGLPGRASLTLHRGEIAGIAGLCGSGRTELLQAIFGLRRRTAGSVTLHGEPLPAEPRQCWRRGVGLLAEDRKHDGLSLRLSIATNVVLPRLSPVCRRGFLRWREAMARAADLGCLVSLRCTSPRQLVRELSGGNQQKVVIARLLHAECAVWLLDEPTRGIDVGSRQEVYRLLDQMARQGAAILVVSSQLPELLGLCDRIAVMRRGELGPFRLAGECTQESLLREAMFGPVGAGGTGARP